MCIEEKLYLSDFTDRVDASTNTGGYSQKANAQPEGRAFAKMQKL
jgi:hypothetical protein